MAQLKIQAGAEASIEIIGDDSFIKEQINDLIVPILGLQLKEVKTIGEALEQELKIPSGTFTIKTKLDKSSKEPETPTTVYDLNIPTRTYDLLQRAGIETVAELTSMSVNDLLKIRNFGIVSLDDVRVELNRYGLTLKEIPDTVNVDTDPIEILNLPIRVYRTLKRSNIRTIGDLTVKTEHDLCLLWNFGTVGLDAVKTALGSHNLALKEPEGL